MKIRKAILIIATISLTGGTVLLWKRHLDDRPAESPSTTAPARPVPLPPSRPAAESSPNHSQRVIRSTPPARHPDLQKTTTRPDREQSDSMYWQNQSARFQQLLDQLDQEQDPARRKRLIQSLAAFVRVDTLGTIEWATGLEDPDEQYAALAAINKYAVNGIGARLMADSSGYPKISETTVLSAVAATGQAGAGDYIVGIVDANGDTISFKNRPMHEVINRLRGSPGSEVQLLIKGNLEDEDRDAVSVAVQRSMIVIFPPDPSTR